MKHKIYVALIAMGIALILIGGMLVYLSGGTR